MTGSVKSNKDVEGDVIRKIHDYRTTQDAQVARHFLCRSESAPGVCGRDVVGTVRLRMHQLLISTYVGRGHRTCVRRILAAIPSFPNPPTFSDNEAPAMLTYP